MTTSYLVSRCPLQLRSLVTLVSSPTGVTVPWPSQYLASQTGNFRPIRPWPVNNRSTLLKAGKPGFRKDPKSANTIQNFHKRFMPLQGFPGTSQEQREDGTDSLLGSQIILESWGMNRMCCYLLLITKLPSTCLCLSLSQRKLLLLLQGNGLL